MNRLWVRLSLTIGGVLFFVFFLQFAQLMRSDYSREGPHPDLPPTQAEIGRRLLNFMALSVVVGFGGGVVISRALSRPITDLARAAHRLGQGELAVRVPVRGTQEMRELAETFNKMAADLQQAETLRSNLMADVSHELRTPLTVLEGNLRAALDKVVPLDEAEVANLYGQTRHLIRLVNDLRELSLAEAARLPLEITPTDLNLLLSETLQALDPLALENNISLVNQTPPLPEGHVDPIRLRQVFINLLSNALRHTPAGGQITLTGEVEAGAVVLSVQDTGEGLEPEQLPAVFDRFYRGDKSRSRETGGTGLGLAIVKAIVEAHGGQVQAFSAGKGKGSQFTVRLPLERRP